MNFKTLFDKEKVWYKKIIIVELCHLSHKSSDEKWTLRKTAKLLELSMGTVSEDLQIAKLIHEDEKIITKCAHRKDALKYL